MSKSASLYNALILDFGSGTIKAGFSGEDMPSLTFESYIGKPKYKKLLGREDNRDIIGPSKELRGLFKLTRPVVHASLKSEFVPKLFNHIWADLKLEQDKFPVFMTEAPFTPLKEKVELASFLFENKGSSSVFFGTQGVLSLYAFGKTDGLMLESGEGVTQVVPIYNGYKLDHAVEKINFGGGDVSAQLNVLLRKNGNIISLSNEQCLFDEMKRAVIELLPTPAEQDGKADFKRVVEEVKYELPDGETINIRSEKVQAAEILFNPSLAGFEFLGLHEMISQSIKRLDLDLRKNMYKNIYISGGNTMINGFPERLGNELSPLVFEKTPVSITAANVDRTVLAWQGGSAVSQLTAFQNLWISEADFKEHGERIFLNKAF